MNSRAREVISYLVFGGLTTLVNIVVYAICTMVLGWAVLASNILAWILSVLFAYVTNRAFVFHSGRKSAAGLLGEAAGFFAGRLATGAFDTLFMIVAVDMLHLPNLVMKVASNVVVIILNYVISKLLVFRSSDGSED